jgi:hypothetical protein
VVAAEFENFVMMFAVAITPFNPSQKIQKSSPQENGEKEDHTHTRKLSSYFNRTSREKRKKK